jgi:hypothetical protein
MNVHHLIGLVAITMAVGCGPQVDRGELGTILSAPPQFDPYEEKYPLPKLNTAQSDGASADEPGKTIENGGNSSSGASER